MALLCAPANAQGPFVLYDDFNSALMDPDKWTSSESRGVGVTLLETVRELHGNRLLLGARAFGNTVPISSPPTPVPSMGTRSGDVNSAFGVTQGFQSLRVSVKVGQAQATGCPDFNATPTTARARLIGFYFNAVKEIPTPGDRTHDVLAQIRIQRASNSPDKSQILEVYGDVVRCLDQGCSSAVTDGPSSPLLGKIMLGQWATVQIDWNGNRVFNLKLNNEQTVVYEIPLSWFVYPVSSHWNALGVSNRLSANCPVNERAMGYVEAEFDNLFVRLFP